MKRARLAMMTLVLVACTTTPGTAVPPAASQSASGTTPPAPSGTSPQSTTLADAELKYRLVDELGPPWFCDPDQHPVAHDDEAAAAADRFDEIRGDGETFAAIVDHLGLTHASFDSAAKLAIYREWKMLNAIVLQPAGTDTFGFDYLVRPETGGDTGTRSTGTIDAGGAVDVDREEAARAPACPICLAHGTLIATPDGPVPVEDLAVGDPVWTVDTVGRRISVPIVRLGSTPAPREHTVIRLRLDDGREVTASAQHPLGDGRPLGDVRVGDTVDGAGVVSGVVLPYGDGRTYDLLPAGPTGVYWAGDVPLRSTLREGRKG